MIKFERIDNRYYNCIVEDSGEQNILVSVSSFEDPNKEKDDNFLSGNFDGVYRFLLDGNLLPIGLLDIVTDRLSKLGIQYTVIGSIDPIIMSNPISENILDGIVLRKYQLQAAHKLLIYKSGILHIATGGGKTEIAASLIKYLNKKTIFIVQRARLMRQTYNRFISRGIKSVGMYGDGCNDTTSNVIICMTQSLYSAIKSSNSLILDLLNDTQFLIVDECQHVASSSHSIIVNSCDAEYRLYLSGTPYDRSEKIDDDNIVIRDVMTRAICGRVISTIPYTYLRDIGVLVPPKISMIKIDNPTVKGFDWYKVYSKGVVDNKSRNSIISRLCPVLLQNGYDKILILVEHIRHGNLLLDLVNKAFLEYGTVYNKIKFASGKEGCTTIMGNKVVPDLSNVNNIFSDFEDGKINVLIGSNILSEGIDLPSMNALILGCGLKASQILKQKIGRGLRTYINKNDIPVFDFIDEQHKFLLNHSNLRINTYLNESFEVFLGITYMQSIFNEDQINFIFKN